MSFESLSRSCTVTALVQNSPALVQTDTKNPFQALAANCRGTARAQVFTAGARAPAGPTLAPPLIRSCRDLDLLTPKSNQFISVPRCTSDKSLAKIHQQTLEISRKHKTTTWITDGRTHGRTTRKHIASAGAYRRRRPPTGGGGLKTASLIIAKQKQI